MYVRCRCRLIIYRELQARRRRGRMSKLRARPCSCKRTRRRVARLPATAADGSPRPPVERTAAPPTTETSLFIYTRDWNAGSLIYGVRLEAIPPPPPSVGSDDDVSPLMQIRPSAEPVARWSEEEHKLSALAAVSGGAILALVHGSRRTVIRDTASGTETPGPRLHRSKREPAMLPVGDTGTTVLVMDTILRPGRCCFEALRRLPGGGWRADALPDPPVELVEGSSRFASYANPPVSAYFASGSRAWISLSRSGTFSLDTETGAWRMEGTWELPLRDLGIFVPELGLVVGIASARHFEAFDPWCCQVCALDVVEAQPPVVRHVWEISPERAEDAAPWRTVSLARLGNGRFCISRSVKVRGASCESTGTSFTLVDVSRLPGGDLQLNKHGDVYCHVWPWGHVGQTRFLQPS